MINILSSSMDNFMSVLKIINYIMLSLLPLIYIPQFFYSIVSLLYKPKTYKNSKKKHSFGYIICAHNEGNVIGKLIESIQKQNYQKKLMHIFVVCDNCTDNTYEVAKNLGCYVIERNDTSKIGKCYALDCGIKHIKQNYSHLGIDAFFIFDADNLVTREYTMVMNNLYSTGCKVATSYRNSHNFKDNAFTSSSAITFFRECEIVHRARNVCGLSTYVSGTGFYVDSKLLFSFDGWPFETLVEDIEFSIYCANNNIKIGYAYDAIFYDEQTDNLKDTFNQRMRWCKGNHQNFFKYFGSMIKSTFKNKNLSSIDMIFHTTPTPAFSIIWTFIYTLILAVVAIVTKASFSEFIASGVDDILFYYLFLYLGGLMQSSLSVFNGYKRIDCNRFKLILYVLIFPVYLIWFIFILAITLFVPVRWKKISHKNEKNIEDLEV